jgi:hypothetical protein
MGIWLFLVYNEIRKVTHPKNNPIIVDRKIDFLTRFLVYTDGDDKPVARQARAERP